mmetsp:Transcript_9041/g.27064  ORF Transcript_9041/g.27064 Transcript_9041/m.27064 type:complete len:348 (+) Transcript_9041:1188-2231(+)
MLLLVKFLEPFAEALFRLLHLALRPLRLALEETHIDLDSPLFDLRQRLREGPPILMVEVVQCLTAAAFQRIFPLIIRQFPSEEHVQLPCDSGVERGVVDGLPPPGGVGDDICPLLVLAAQILELPLLLPVARQVVFRQAPQGVRCQVVCLPEPGHVQRVGGEAAHGDAHPAEHRSVERVVVKDLRDAGVLQIFAEHLQQAVVFAPGVEGLHVQPVPHAALRPATGVAPPEVHIWPAVHRETRDLAGAVWRNGWIPTDDLRVHGVPAALVLEAHQDPDDPIRVGLRDHTHHAARAPLIKDFGPRFAESFLGVAQGPWLEGVQLYAAAAAEEHDLAFERIGPVAIAVLP